MQYLDSETVNVYTGMRVSKKHMQVRLVNQGCSTLTVANPHISKLDL